MAAEVHDLILGFDKAYAIRAPLTELIGRKVGIYDYVDSRERLCNYIKAPPDRHMIPEGTLLTS